MIHCFVSYGGFPPTGLTSGWSQHAPPVSGPCELIGARHLSRISFGSASGPSQNCRFLSQQIRHHRWSIEASRWAEMAEPARVITLAGSLTSRSVFR